MIVQIAYFYIQPEIFATLNQWFGTKCLIVLGEGHSV